MNDALTAGLYVHVPFCRSKCVYCDFYSQPAEDLAPRWVTGVLREAGLFRDHFSAFDTIYLGGGTPSLLRKEDLGRLLCGLREGLKVGPDSEITLEANPDDVRLDLARHWLDLGINRLSIGVQAFDDASLRFLGRRHSGTQADRALDVARQAGFTNLGIDLIWGLPGQTIDAWFITLERALAVRPEHLSCYELSVEQGTPLHALVKNNHVRLPDESSARAFFVETSRLLESRGYSHYEISNFARAERFRSRHNQKYWHHVPYLGLGPSAHSFDGERRWWNIRSIRDYCRALEAGQLPIAGKETPDQEARRLETLLLGFRTREGVSLDRLGRGPHIDRGVDQAVRSGLLKIDGNRLVPTLAGWLIADQLPLFFC